ncbi:MAG: hypothetical protein ACRDNG_02820 [Gaiellaceae bacterium]
MTPIIVGLIIFAVIGFAVNRWWTLVLPLATWPIYYHGLRTEWWGSGVGDGWQDWRTFAIAASVLATLLGIGVRRLGGSMLSVTTQTEKPPEKERPDNTEMSA